MTINGKPATVEELEEKKKNLKKGEELVEVRPGEYKTRLRG